MLDMLARTWWTTLIRGLVLVALGVVALLWPGLTLVALVYTYAVFAIADGVFSLVALMARAGRGPWWAQLLGGLLSLAAGAMALFLPGLTAVALLYLIAAWAVVRGIMDIVVAVELRKEITGEWFLVLAGVVSVLFGVLLVLQPGAGMLALLWLLGAFALVAGVSLIVLAFRLRGAGGRMQMAREARTGV